MKRLIPLITFLVFTIPGISHAGVFVQMGIHAGGDDLATVGFVGGSTEDISAGGLLSGSVGLELGVTESIDVRLGLGLKFDSVTAENGDLDFSRNKIDALVFYRFTDWHLGVGVTRHSSVSFEGSGFFAGIDTPFDDANGTLVALDYQLGERGYLGLRITSIEYVPTGTSTTVDGNSVGVVIGYRFGK